ncbi:MAG: hypothetical protein IPM63_13615 [Acidobacteriota bacterium]|nr:MAG: hypothetical protein IPM63_13615 [Acidobacteriota bacterium]
MTNNENEADRAVDQRVKRLEKQLRLALVIGLLFLGLFVLTASSGRTGDEQVFEKIRVRQIIVVDEKGVERIYIGSPVPDPKADGQQIQRIAPVTGITMNDENGNERNGWGIFPDGRQTFCLDYDKGIGEALCLTQGGERSGLMIKDTKQRFNLILGRLAVGNDDDEAKLLMMGTDGKSSIRLQLTDDTGKPLIKVTGDKGESIFETKAER